MHIVIAGIPSRFHTKGFARAIRRRIRRLWPRISVALSFLECEKAAVLTIMVFDEALPGGNQAAVRFCVADVCANHTREHGWWYKGFYFDPLNQRPKLGKEEK